MSDQSDDSIVGLRVVAIIVIAVVAAVVIYAASLTGMPAGAPVTEAVVVEIEIPEPVGEPLARIYFEIGSAVLAADAADAVARTQAALIATPDAIVLLSGYHDPSGDAVQNAELAKARALAVREALVAAGIEEERMRLRKPESTAADGPPEEARRVEIRVQ